MNVKNAFLNDVIEEKIYVIQFSKSIHEIFQNHIFKFSKALYRLKQAPKAWYEHLCGFLHEKGFSRGCMYVDTTLFIKKNSFGNLLFV